MGRLVDEKHSQSRRRSKALLWCSGNRPEKLSAGNEVVYGRFEPTMGRTATSSMLYLGKDCSRADDMVDFPEPGTPAKAIRTRPSGSDTALAGRRASMRLQRRETLSPTSGVSLAIAMLAGVEIIGFGKLNRLQARLCSRGTGHW